MSNVYSVIHEGGHAIFGQCETQDKYDHFIDQSMTMAMHESVSRFYENRIGRSREFIHLIYPKFKELFIDEFSDVSEEELYNLSLIHIFLEDGIASKLGIKVILISDCLLNPTNLPTENFEVSPLAQLYQGIPHLLIPVVTDTKQASSALNWAVMEMGERYKKFAEVNVRNLSLIHI